MIEFREYKKPNNEIADIVTKARWQTNGSGLFVEACDSDKRVALFYIHFSKGRDDGVNWLDVTQPHFYEGTDKDTRTEVLDQLGDYLAKYLDGSNDLVVVMPKDGMDKRMQKRGYRVCSVANGQDKAGYILPRMTIRDVGAEATGDDGGSELYENFSGDSEDLEGSINSGGRTDSEDLNETLDTAIAKGRDFSHLGFSIR